MADPEAATAVALAGAAAVITGILFCRASGLDARISLFRKML
jgi:hypothetical protein